MDKSGKHTASVQLAEYLIKLGYNVVQSEFHRYDTPTGKLIQDYYMVNIKYQRKQFK